MAIGIAGGLVMGGLVLGALSGSIWLMLCFAAAGLLVAGIAELLHLNSCQLSAGKRKIDDYPPYGY